MRMTAYNRRIVLRFVQMLGYGLSILPCANYYLDMVGTNRLIPVLGSALLGSLARCLALVSMPCLAIAAMYQFVQGVYDIRDKFREKRWLREHAERIA